MVINMARQANIYGGGALTNAHGLYFEQTTSLNDALVNQGYRLKTNGEVFNLKGVFMGYSKSKQDFIRFLDDNKVNLNLNSDTLLPDDAFINIQNRIVYIIEKKFQSVAGSVDEKLQTCLYKKQQYIKLVSQIGFKVAYTYVLNDWFSKPKYIDVLEYIKNVGCYYFFNELPLDFLGL